MRHNPTTIVLLQILVVFEVKQWRGKYEICCSAKCQSQTLSIIYAVAVGCHGRVHFINMEITHNSSLSLGSATMTGWFQV